MYVLDFEGTDLDGLEVRVTGASLGEFLSLGQFADDVDAAQSTRAELAAVDGLVTLLASKLVNWNLGDGAGGTVPATKAGLLSLEASQVMLIVGAWQKAVAAVPAPLLGASTSGSPSLAGSMPMEPLSPSLAS